MTYEFLDGNCEDTCTYSNENVSEGPVKNHNYRLIDAIVKSVCDSVEDGDADVHL